MDYFHYRNCLLLLCQHIKGELAKQAEIGLMGFIVRALKKGHYVLVSLQNKRVF